MLLAHAITLTEARSALAALADHARNPDASIEYERALLQLDWLHEAVTPAITPPQHDAREVLFEIAERALHGLVEFGIDELEIELVLDMLDAARTKDPT